MAAIRVVFDGKAFVSQRGEVWLAGVLIVIAGCAPLRRDEFDALTLLVRIHHSVSADRPFEVAETHYDEAGALEAIAIAIKAGKSHIIVAEESKVLAPCDDEFTQKVRMIAAQSNAVFEVRHARGSYDGQTEIIGSSLKLNKE